MPETISEKTVFSLLEVSLSIKKIISERYKSSFWVKAEMNKLNLYSQSGHCYPELVEKKDSKVVAQIKAIIWKDDFIRINNQFQSVLKEPLRNGIKILFCARISYDPSFGLSLNIIDIDPSWSLGELEKEKAETIEKLIREGIYHQNKKLLLPLLPKRIAVISVETSKGYADFMNIIGKNQWGYQFFTMLFPALLQGEKAIIAIRQQMERIKKVSQHFDVVAIIRGGGGDAGLSCYNDYQLARDIALFPIPVVTGIGHATNETVAEMISFKNAITPTALANFLIQAFHNFNVPLLRAADLIPAKTKSLLADENTRLKRSVRDLQSSGRYMLMQEKHRIKNLTGSAIQEATYMGRNQKNNLKEIASQIAKKFSVRILNENHFQVQLHQKISNQSLIIFDSHKKELSNLTRILHSSDPKQILARGYSITRMNGKIVRSAGELKTSDLIETIFADGALLSEIKFAKKEKEINNGQ
jgi:exodeoxyribonuclease VII large subunit